MKDFLRLTSLEGDVILIQPESIEWLKQLHHPKRTLITTTRDKEIVVQEEALTISLRAGGRIIEKEETTQQYSKAHVRLAELLQDPRVLTNPEEFLGPNYKAVLDFWLSIDKLTEEQWETIDSRDLEFYRNQRSEYCKAEKEAYKASIKTIGKKFTYNASRAAYNDYGSVSSACDATKELIGNVENPVFLKMFPKEDIISHQKT